MRLEITGHGFRDGHLGFYQKTFQGDQCVETQFLFLEGDYIRLYAYKKPHFSQYLRFPPGTYLVKTQSLTVGDSWNTYFSGPAVATVVSQSKITVPAGEFSCYEVEIKDQAAQELLFVAWFCPDLGVVQWGVPDVALLVLEEFKVVGGTGTYPLAVGNYWITNLLQPPKDHPRKDKG
jgi:hypothetical protein